MVGRRLGRTNFGCLLSLLLAVTAIYFGVNVGDPYVRYYRYLDGMKQEARFSARFTDDDIQRHLSALADSGVVPAGRMPKLRLVSSGMRGAW